MAGDNTLLRIDRAGSELESAMLEGNWADKVKGSSKLNINSFI